MALRRAAATAAARGAKALHTLSSRAVVSVRGSDAEAFLQGLTTNDVPNLPDGKCMYTGFLNHSGRLLVRSPRSPPRAL
jgi:folate-binding Fe-S cluster repair protein YgfZ